jgi:hypothetical protein
MKLYSSNSSFNQFYFLEIVYKQFYLDETIPFSLFISLLPCHQKILCDTSFIKNETLE